MKFHVNNLTAPRVKQYPQNQSGFDIVELNEDDLNVIAGGNDKKPENDVISPTGISFNHNETIVIIQEITPNPSPEIVELSEEDLNVIAGAGDNPPIIHNHNETVVSVQEITHTPCPEILELSEDDLNVIAGGNYSRDLIHQNHNETIIDAEILELNEDDLNVIVGGNNTNNNGDGISTSA
jgi:hypothetical protein